jgi:DNA-binding beta-propeller fold protein YncE
LIDADNNTVLAPLENLAGGGGTLVAAAFDEATDRVFLMDTSNESVLIRDATSGTLASVASVSVAAATNEGEMVVKGDGTKAYFLDAGANLVRIINQTGATTYALSGTTVGPGAGTAGLIDLAVTPDDNFLYVTLQGSHHFSVINLTTEALVLNSPILLTVGDSPIGVTIPPVSPVPLTGEPVFIVGSSAGTNAVLVRDNLAPLFGPNLTQGSIAFANANTLATRIKHIHVPF